MMLYVPAYDKQINISSCDHPAK